MTSAQHTMSWREGLLLQLRYVVAASWVLCCLVGIFWSRSTELRLYSISVAVVLGAVSLVLLRRSLPFRTRAWTAIAGMSLVALPAYLIVGFNPGPPLILALCVVLATLLLGWKAAALYLTCLVAALLSLTTAIWTGVWTGPPAAETSTTDPLVWLRITALSAIMWGSIGYAIFFVVNTVERTLKEREGTLFQLRDEVKQRQAAERAQRKAEAIAHQSQKLESLGHLAAGVAHDFNNALLVVQGWNDILRESDRGEHREQGTQAIQQATEQAGQLARQLLTFARQDIRQPRYLLADRLIKDTMATLQPLLPPSVEMSVDTEAGAALFVDETQMRQLLFNLVINSRDAMPDGGRIAVSNRRVANELLPRQPSDLAHSGEWVVLGVEDNGPGMDGPTRERAFEPFFTTKDQGKGTGLGLSTAFGIVRQSGGHIDLASEPGRGTRFAIYLPAVEVAPEATAGETTRTAPANGAQRRVLVLEDDGLAGDLICFALRHAGVHITVARDGDEALRQLQESRDPIDILCTDAVFPGAPLSDVIEAFERACPNGRVLVCSGYVQESLTIEGLESGAYAFLAKPFTATELVQKIDDLMAGRDGHGPGARAPRSVTLPS